MLPNENELDAVTLPAVSSAAGFGDNRESTQKIRLRLPTPKWPQIRMLNSQKKENLTEQLLRLAMFCLLIQSHVLVASEGSSSAPVKMQTMDCGTFKLSDFKEFSFQYENITSQTVQIKSVTPSTGSIIVEDRPVRIEPNEKALFDIVYLPERLGEFSADILVSCGDDKSIRFVVKGTVIADPEMPDEAGAILAARGKREKDLVIDIEKLIDMPINEPGIQYVDIRSNKDYVQCRIPSAVQVPLKQIHLKQYWKQSKGLLLISKGYDMPLLFNQCRRLQKQGFQVKIVRGGMNAWVRTGAMPTAGNSPFSCYMLTPQEFHTAAKAVPWILVNMTGRRRLHSTLSSLVRVDAPIASEEWSKKMVQLLDSPDTAGSSVLVINNNGQGYPAIEKQISAKGLQQVFYLKGGLKTFEQFARRIRISPIPRIVSKQGGCGCSKHKH